MSISIVEVDTNIILPKNELGVVMFHPCINITQPLSTPFFWTGEEKILQLKKIAKTLEISKAKKHTCPKTHFTIFPEYTIPGKDGLKLIEDEMKKPDWDNNTFVIGGLDALSKNDFKDIYADNDSSYYDIDAIQAGKWINCCVIFGKTNNNVKKWIQIKLKSAPAEENIRTQMFCGDKVLLFLGKFEQQNSLIFRFITLICYDWIQNSNISYQGVLDVIASIPVNTGEKKDLNFTFVISCNDKPNNSDFITVTKTFFEQQGSFIPDIVRDKSFVIFANTARQTSMKTENTFGCSSIVYHPAANSYFNLSGSKQTVAFSTKKFRNGSQIGRCRDIVFREFTECIHSFKLINPWYRDTNSGSLSYPIYDSEVYHSEGINTDKRKPNGPVEPEIKWVCDEIDNSEVHLSSHDMHVLCNEYKIAHDDIIGNIQNKSGEEINKIIETAVQANEKYENVDEWNEKQVIALNSLLHSLKILKVSNLDNGILSINKVDGHAVVKTSEIIYEFVIISGNDHQECYEKGKKILTNNKNIKVVITRDNDNTALTEKELRMESSIYKLFKKLVKSKANITKTDIIHYAFSNLTTNYIDSNSKIDLQNKIKRGLDIT